MRLPCRCRFMCRLLPFVRAECCSRGGLLFDLKVLDDWTVLLLEYPRVEVRNWEREVPTEPSGSARLLPSQGSPADNNWLAGTLALPGVRDVLAGTLALPGVRDVLAGTLALP